MSRLYEALRKLEQSNQHSSGLIPGLAHPSKILNNVMNPAFDIEGAQPVRVNLPSESRLVAISAPRSLGAEKFRALVSRLENLRHQRELKSFQVTSSVVSEGKSMIAANLAVTLAGDGQSRVLLLEGDLRKPTQTTLFGLKGIKGIIQWWSDSGKDLSQYLYRLNDMSLWFLGAGAGPEHPSDLLQSPRFTEAFAALAAKFDWVVVDSTPMLPIVDANLWSRLVDGTLLVIREGAAPITAIKKGLESLDNPKLIGVVLNEASEYDRSNYTNYGYYASR
jgi:protein-tyrosine kinase